MSGNHRARVLVADDHRPIVERVLAVLAEEFSVIGTVTDGAELVAAEAALRPDVVVVDIGMPGMSGLEATAEIRSRGSLVPIVCLTAYGVSEMLEAAWRAGVSAYVSKVSLARDLVPAIHAVLDGRRFVSGATRPDAVPDYRPAP